MNFDYSLKLQVQCKLMQIGLVFSWFCFLLFIQIYKNFTKGVIYYPSLNKFFMDFVDVKIIKSQELEHKAFLLKLGQHIVFLRKKFKLSQNDLAYKIGWDKPNLRKIEHGKGNPTVKSLLLIAEGLGVTIDELFKFQ